MRPIYSEFAKKSEYKQSLGALLPNISGLCIFWGNSVRITVFRADEKSQVHGAARAFLMQALLPEPAS